MSQNILDAKSLFKDGLFKHNYCRPSECESNVAVFTTVFRTVRDARIIATISQTCRGRLVKETYHDADEQMQRLLRDHAFNAKSRYKLERELTFFESNRDDLDFLDTLDFHSEHGQEIFHTDIDEIAQVN